MLKNVLFYCLAAFGMFAVASPKRMVYMKNNLYPDFSTYPVYEGNDLGYVYAPTATEFKLWSPPAEAVQLKLFSQGLGGAALKTIQLKKGSQGVWSTRISGDQKGKYYAFQVKINGAWLQEVTDPYAVATGANGKRGLILDLQQTNPPGWAYDTKPKLQSPTDMLIYELHIRDLSSHASSGIAHKGKYLGLTETKTKSPEGLTTGLDHLKELGITHVHLLPVFDFKSIDETKPYDPNVFNWGYDPQNYNTPEGSYSTNAANGAVRIKEFKQMVLALHQKGIRLIMDVVYNHTGDTEQSNFNQLVPGYYFRQNNEGGFSNASACGNETASERPMMRKFLIQSVLHWVKEYHVDGFRFDLMGIHDIETMNAISKAVHAVDPTIFLYGEGWTAGGSPLADGLRALKINTKKLDHIAAFSDDMRDGIRGNVFNTTEKGFASGRPGLKESVKFGIVASTYHPDVDYNQVNYSKAPWADEPYQTITYTSCHDNHTLWDRLSITNPEDTEKDRINMYKLATTMVLTSQGVPFLHAGTEMLVTKQGYENSYNSPDSINQLNWSRKFQYKAEYDYIRTLIYMRKIHPAFRMRSSQMIREHLKFVETGNENVVAYLILNNANGDSWNTIAVMFNGSNEPQGVFLPESNWNIVLNGEKVELNGTLGKFRSTTVMVPAYSATILYTDALEGATPDK
jgi:pullulanase